MPEATNMISGAAAEIRHLVADLRRDMHSNRYWRHEAVLTESETYRLGVDNGLGGEAGAFAASWTPEVALAVAAWLDTRSVVEDPQSEDWRHALLVARAYLGEES